MSETWTSPGLKREEKNSLKPLPSISLLNRQHVLGFRVGSLHVLFFIILLDTNTQSDSRSWSLSNYWRSPPLALVLETPARGNRNTVESCVCNEATLHCYGNLRFCTSRSPYVISSCFVSSVRVLYGFQSDSSGEVELFTISLWISHHRGWCSRPPALFSRMCKFPRDWMTAA